MATIIGIESTAHTFGVGIVKDGEVIANATDMYTTEEGGIIPVDSAKHHSEVKYDVYKKALEEAGFNSEDKEEIKKNVDAISFSKSPGLPPCLLEGVKFAKELAVDLNKPLIPVNHCIAHLEIGKKTGASDPVMLYTSGANTQIIAYASGKYRVFGETLDVGVGNFIDNFARYAGIGFPGGPKIQKLAEEAVNSASNGSPEYVEIPYRVKGEDIALSGILTNLKQKIESGKYKTRDLAYSMQETVFSMLVETAERALAHTGKKELLLGGGVACNSRLQEMCEIMCKERQAKYFCPPKPLLVDQGAMIAYLGETLYNNNSKVIYPFSEKSGSSGGSEENKKNKEFEELDINSRERTDDVVVDWE